MCERWETCSCYCGRRDPWCVIRFLRRIFHSTCHRLVLCRRLLARPPCLRWNGIGYLLNCSNTSVLNRPPKYDELHDEQDRLWGDLAALEGLAQVISLNHMGDRERGPIETNEVESALQLPVHRASRSSTSPAFSSDEEMSSDEDPGS